jgi:hypothetical protein
MINCVELTPLLGHPLRATRRDVRGVRLEFDDGQAVAVETEFSLDAADHAEQRIDPAGTDPEGLRRAFAPLLGQRVRRCEALDGGELVLEFEDGTRLLAPAGDRYESWAYTGPCGLLVVALPEGGLALFPGR